MSREWEVSHNGWVASFCKATKFRDREALQLEKVVVEQVWVLNILTTLAKGPLEFSDEPAPCIVSLSLLQFQMILIYLSHHPVQGPQTIARKKEGQILDHCWIWKCNTMEWKSLPALTLSLITVFQIQHDPICPSFSWAIGLISPWPRGALSHKVSIIWIEERLKLTCRKTRLVSSEFQWSFAHKLWDVLGPILVNHNFFHINWTSFSMSPILLLCRMKPPIHCGDLSFSGTLKSFSYLCCFSWAWVHYTVSPFSSCALPKAWYSFNIRTCHQPVCIWIDKALRWPQFEVSSFVLSLIFWERIDCVKSSPLQVLS